MIIVDALVDTGTTQFHSRSRDKATRIEVGKEFKLHENSQFGGKAFSWIGKGS